MNIIDKIKQSFSSSKEQLVDDKSLSKEQVDTMHYFCIPDPVEKGQYIINTIRSGIPEEDSGVLPVKRIFHVPEAGVIKDMKEAMIKMDKETLQTKLEKESIRGDGLVSFSEYIDKTNDKVSTGMIAAGAATCLINPPLGIAIISKSLVPSLGARLATDLVSKSGNAINEWSDKKTQEKVEEELAGHTENCHPEIEPNFILYKLNRGLSDKTYEPLLEVDDIDSEVIALVPMIKPIYEPFLKKSFFGQDVIGVNLKKYLTHLFGRYDYLKP